MSQEPADLFYHDPFNDDDRRKFTHSFFNNSPQNLQQGFDPSSYMSFTECLHGSGDYNTLARAFGLSPNTSTGLFSNTVKEEQKPVIVETRDVVTGGETPVTPNSSVFSSSIEAGEDEECNNNIKKEKQPKGSCEDGGESSKKV